MTTRAALPVLLLVGCDLVVRYPSGGESLIDPDPTGLVDTAVLDTHPDTDVAVDCVSAWWPDAAHAARVMVSVSVPAPGLVRAPVLVPLDLPAIAADLGLAPLDPTSIRAVLQDCGQFPAQTVQWVDQLRTIPGASPVADPSGDGVGTLAVLLDLDGDPATSERIPSSSITMGIYIDDAPATVAPLTTDLSVVQDGDRLTVEAAGTTVTLDASRGGLIDDLGLTTTGGFASQADSCCGNSMHFWNTATFAGAPFGWVGPGLDAATVTVLADGPVFAAVLASGTRVATVPDGSTSYGTYTFDNLYWRFAYRPEVHHSATHTAVTACTTEHDTEASYGFRPLQMVHTLADGDTDPTWVSDQATRTGAVYLADRGFGVRMNQSPAFFARVANPVGSTTPGPLAPRLLAMHGNEVVPSGVLAPQTVSAGSLIFDGVGFVLLPFDGDWDAASTELQAASTGVRVALSDPELAP